MNLWASEKIPDALKDLAIEPKLGSQLSLSEELIDEKGQIVKLGDFFDGKHPVILIMSYYECAMLCGIVLNAVRDAIVDLDWLPKDHYRIVTISIDPKETPALALAKKDNFLKTIPSEAKRLELETEWHFLTAQDGVAKRISETIGFKYRWIPEENQFAHGAAIFLISPSGKLTRSLMGAAYSPKDLKLGLLEASAGKVGTIAEKLLLFCYHYDPKDNQYALFATRLMRVGAALTVAVMLGLYLYWFRTSRQKKGIV